MAASFDVRKRKSTTSNDETIKKAKKMIKNQQSCYYNSRVISDKLLKKETVEDYVNSDELYDDSSSFSSKLSNIKRCLDIEPKKPSIKKTAIVEPIQQKETTVDSITDFKDSITDFKDDDEDTIINFLLEDNPARELPQEKVTKHYYTAQWTLDCIEQYDIRILKLQKNKLKTKKVQQNKMKLLEIDISKMEKCIIDKKTNLYKFNLQQIVDKKTLKKKEKILFRQQRKQTKKQLKQTKKQKKKNFIISECSD